MDNVRGRSAVPATIRVMEERLIDLARARGGLLTVPEAVRLGVRPARLSRLRDAGVLVHVRRGAYALADSWADATELQRYALRTRAVLRTRPGVAASHHAALTMAGVPTWGVPWHRIDVVDVTGVTTRVRGKAGLFLHPRPVRSEIVTDDLGDARVDVTTALLHVARDTSPIAFAVALDQALRGGLVTTGAVGAALGLEAERRRWVRQATDLLAGADPLSPCVEATRLRIMLVDMGFRPRLRVPLRSASGGPVLRAELLIGTSIAVSRTAFTDRERDRLRGLGVAVAVVADVDLGHPDRVAASIAAAMRELEELRLPRARGA